MLIRTEAFSHSTRIIHPTLSCSHPDTTNLRVNCKLITARRDFGRWFACMTMLIPAHTYRACSLSGLLARRASRPRNHPMRAGLSRRAESTAKRQNPLICVMRCRMADDGIQALALAAGDLRTVLPLTGA